MKRLLTFLVGLVLTIIAISQVPQKMSYQAVVRSPTNQLITNQQIKMRVSILQGSASGTAVYVETHTPSTNANGLATLEIGDGTVETGTFSSINWSTGLYFIKTETDPAGGTVYTITGTSQLLSVPYALYSKTSLTTNDAVKLTGDQTISGDKTFIGTINAGGQQIKNVGSPLVDQDAATKLYVDSKQSWIIFHEATQSIIGNNAPVINTGYRNIFIGSYSGLSNLTGMYNAFFGSEAGYSNKIGNYNVAIGQGALRENDEGSENVAIGLFALEKNKVLTPGSLGGPGFQNVAIGAYALRNAVANMNVAVGGEVLKSLTNGVANTGVGEHVMRSLVTGGGNTAMGYMSMIDATGSANNNVAIGVRSGQNVSGQGNVFLGFESGNLSQGQNNVFIGNGSGWGTTWQNVSNRLIINNNANTSDIPLIYGEFDNSLVHLNANVNIRDVLKLTPKASAPANPSEGDIYYNSTTHKLMVYDGTNWMACW
jgi:trimeric autotransporter adhesin